MCNNAPSLSLNRTAIVERCGARTAELLLVTAVLHLPQPDTRAALEHHFISSGRAGGQTELPQQTENWCRLRGTSFLSLSEGIIVCVQELGASSVFCWLNLSLTCVLKTNISPDLDLFSHGKGVLT